MSKKNESKNLSLLQLKAAIQARVPAMLVGAPGTSKTAMVRKLSEEMGYHLITLVPSRLEATDLSGFPGRSTYEVDGHKMNVTEYAPQLWQIEILRRKKVLLFLDEFSNAHPSVRASLLSFIQDREFPNGDKFPEETVLVAAMNPTDSAADGYELDKATSNRIMFIRWNPSNEEWLKGMIDSWGERPDMSDREKEWRSKIVRFLTDNPGDIHRENDPSQANTQEAYGILGNDSSAQAVAQYAWASRRSWDNLAKVLGTLEVNDITLEDEIVQSIVGVSVTQRFREWLQKNSSLNVNKIINAPDDFKNWETLTLDEIHIIFRSAIDGASPKNVKNVIRMFAIMQEIDHGSFVAPFLNDFAGIVNKPEMKVLSTSDRSKLRTLIVKTLQSYQDIAKNATNRRKASNS